MSNMEQIIEQKLLNIRKQSEKVAAAKKSGSAMPKKSSGGGSNADQKKTTESDKKEAVVKKPSGGSDSKASSTSTGNKTDTNSKSKEVSSGKKNVNAKDGTVDKKANDNKKETTSSSISKTSDKKSNNVKHEETTSNSKTSKPSDKKEESSASKNSKPSDKNLNAGKKDEVSSKTSDKKATESKKSNDAKKDKAVSESKTSKSTDKKSSSDQKEVTSSSSSKIGEKVNSDWNESWNESKKWDDSTGKEGAAKTDRKSQGRKSSTSDEKSRDRSTTPPWSTRQRVGAGGYVRRYLPSRSRSPSRKRSKTPVRGSFRDTKRYSPAARRRSRSPRGRRSRSPREGRSRSSRYSRSRSRSPRYERVNPKALLAKKSFLDDLAVKFAQEGKEFPELEQYRCEINSQFVSYPMPSQFAQNAVEHTPACVYTQMESTMPYIPPPSYPMPAPEPLIEVPSLIAYPIAGAMGRNPPPPSSVNPPPAPIIQPEAIMPANKKTAVSDLLVSKQFTAVLLPSGPKPKTGSIKGCVLEVKPRIEQAIGLLDDLEQKVRKSGKFFYRAQTFYANNFHENRSPLIQGPCNPLFAINSQTGETSDPFANLSNKVRPIIQAFCLDEGAISMNMFLRRQKKELAIAARKQKQQAEERERRQMMMSLPKVQLQKSTQTEPTVCTECLIRKLKFKATSGTQTPSRVTVDNAVQTIPMPMHTVSEFGSITELTPNQVRAVSEFIKYIKMTATSGTLPEMRNSMRNNEMYNRSNDLYMAYQYFDEMVESRNRVEVPQPPPPPTMTAPVEQHPSVPAGASDFKADRDPIDEYEEFHKNFCEAETATDFPDQYEEPRPEDDGEIFDENFENNPTPSYVDPFGYGRGRSFNQGPGGSMNNNKSTRGKRGGRGRGQFNPRGTRPFAFKRK